MSNFKRYTSSRSSLRNTSHSRSSSKSPLRTFKRQLAQRARTHGQFFFCADEDRNNKVTFREFSKGVALMGIRPIPTPDQLRELFHAFDVNDDGTISWRELQGGRRTRVKSSTTPSPNKSKNIKDFGATPRSTRPERRRKRPKSTEELHSSVLALSEKLAAATLYSNLCERRIKELVPDHIIPVTPECLGIRPNLVGAGLSSGYGRSSTPASKKKEYAASSEARLRRQAEEATERAVRLEEELRRATTKIASLEGTNGNRRNDNEENRRTVTQPYLDKENEAILDNLSEGGDSQSISNLRAQLEDALSERDSLATQLDELRASMVKLNENLSSLGSEKAAIELIEAVDNLEREKVALVDYVKDAAERNRTLTAELQALKANIHTDIDSRIEHERRQNSAIKVELDEARSEANALQFERERRQQLEDEMSELAAIQAELLEKLGEAQRKLTSVTERSEDTEQLLAAARAEVDALERQQEVATMRHKLHERTSETAAEENSRLRSELSKKLNSCEAELVESRKLASGALKENEELKEELRIQKENGSVFKARALDMEDRAETLEASVEVLQEESVKMKDELTRLRSFANDVQAVELAIDVEERKAVEVVVATQADTVTKIFAALAAGSQNGTETIKENKKGRNALEVGARNEIETKSRSSDVELIDSLCLNSTQGEGCFTDNGNATLEQLKTRVQNTGSWTKSAHLKRAAPRLSNLVIRQQTLLVKMIDLLLFSQRALQNSKEEARVQIRLLHDEIFTLRKKNENSDESLSKAINQVSYLEEAAERAGVLESRKRDLEFALKECTNARESEAAIMMQLRATETALRDALEESRTEKRVLIARIQELESNDKTGELLISQNELSRSLSTMQKEVAAAKESEREALDEIKQLRTDLNSAVDLAERQQKLAAALKAERIRLGADRKVMGTSAVSFASQLETLRRILFGYVSNMTQNHSDHPAVQQFTVDWEEYTERMKAIGKMEIEGDASTAAHQLALLCHRLIEYTFRDTKRINSTKSTMDSEQEILLETLRQSQKISFEPQLRFHRSGSITVRNLSSQGVEKDRNILQDVGERRADAVRFFNNLRDKNK